MRHSLIAEHNNTSPTHSQDRMPPPTKQKVALPPRPLEVGHRISERYILGQAIGKGAFGTVYECQNQETGEIVAVKRVALRNLSSDQLKGLELEVDVMKNLHHENIVKYIATVRTRNHLHIVLQYMENGSLEKNIKKFGVFAPSLVSFYTKQVLQGLAYLHEQGVIHRDIKCANILSDKLGRVKLADFGVAIRFQAAEATYNGEMVVGTPYWMAPEIIEMNSPPTTACDVWSVGCTVLEMLTGKPPYFEVPQMAAVYRIVQDEIVPVPENQPEEVLNFLRRCFIKQSQNRPSAVDLLKHPWILGTRSQPAYRQSADDATNISDYKNEDPLMIIEAKRTQSGATPVASSLPGNSISSQASTGSDHSAHRSSAVGNQHAGARHRHSLPGQVYDTISFEQSADAALPILPSNGQRGVSGGSSDQGSWRNSIIGTSAPNSITAAALSAVGEIDVEDWDRELEVGEHSAQGSAWTGHTQRVKKDQMERPHSMRGMEQMAQRRAVQGSPALQVANPKIALHLHPATKSLHAETVAVEFEDAFEGDRPIVGEFSFRAGGGSAAARKKKGQRLAKFRESADDADFHDLAVNDKGMKDLAQELAKRREIQSASVSDNAPPAAIAVAAAVANDDNETGRSIRAQRANEVQDLVNKLRPSGKASSSSVANSVLEASNKLVALFKENPTLKRTLLTHHGVAPLLDTLSKCNDIETVAILNVLVEIADNDRSFQELLAMAGVVPILTRLAGKDAPLATRRAASQLVTQFLCTSPVALHMFVACGGLAAIVVLLESKSQDDAPTFELAVIALDGVQRVFAETVAPPGSHRRASMARAAAAAEARGNGVGGVPKNDFRLLFAKTLLLERLAAFGQMLQTREGHDEASRNGMAPVGVLAEVCHVMSVFSQGGTLAKTHVAHSPKVLRFMLTTITQRWAAAAGANEDVWEDDVDDDVDCVRTLLHCLKNLATEASCLDKLDAVGLVPAVVPLLSVRLGPSTSGLDHDTVRKLRQRRQIPAVATALSEVHNVSMLILFYMLRLSPSRQERAATCGIIPYAKSASLDRTTVKTFATQILVDLAYASDYSRVCLYRDGALDFFLETLIGPDPFWQERALQALEQFLVPTSPNLRPKDPSSKLAAVGTLSADLKTPSRSINMDVESKNDNASTPIQGSSINEEIERSLLRPYALRRFVELFQSSQSEYFESILKTLINMLSASSKLAEAIGRSGLFVAEICARLQYPKAEVRINLLKLLSLVVERHADLETLLLEHNLPAIVASVDKQAKAQKLVVVSSYAEKLLSTWKTTLNVA